jgi:hypothetical protein
MTTVIKPNQNFQEISMKFLLEFFYKHEIIGKICGFEDVSYDKENIKKHLS